MKNCVNPSKVFYFKCSQDVCQERMISLGKDHPKYVSSAILSKKYQEFSDSVPALIEFLEKNTSFYIMDASSSET